MTHTKFIELLNLYLDHEISMEDAATLEAEIQRDPKRRSIYRQYCQMQRGCAELATVFAAAEAVPTERRRINAIAPAPSRFNGWTYGAAAAAACAVFTFVTLTRQPEPATAGNLAVTEPAARPTVATEPAANPAPAVYSLAELTSVRPELHAVYTPTLVNLTTTAPENHFLYATAAGDRFDWMDQVKLAPVEGDEFSFRVRPVMVEGERTYRSQRPIEGKVEMTAFQFRR